MMWRAISLLLAIWMLLALGTPSPALALTLEEEHKMGKEAFDQIIGQIRQIDDPETVAYIGGLGKKLASRRLGSPFKYRFYVADQPVVNAFALPGGYIFLFKGMITSFATEGELVGVMAHEMAHVYYRHISSRMKKAGKVGKASLAGLVAGLLLGALAGAPQLGTALAMGSVAGGQQQMLAYSRMDEEQADFGAFKLLAKAGYQPSEMADSFERLYREERYSGAAIPTYLRTHPASAERMENMLNLVRRNPVDAEPYDNSQFLFVRARLQGLYGRLDTTLDDLRDQVRRRPGDPYAHYALGLAEMRDSNFEVALVRFKSLKKAWPHNTSLLREIGDCLQMLGHFAQAEASLKEALRKKPGDPLTVLALGQTYAGQKRWASAAPLLAQALKGLPNSGQVHYELGIAYGHLGKEGMAALHLGLAMLARGSYSPARYHLVRAMRHLSGEKRLEAQKALARIDKKKLSQNKAEEEARKKPEDR